MNLDGKQAINRDFTEVKHPCLRRTMVPIWARPAATADPAGQTISDTTMDMLAYIFRDQS